MFNSSKMYEKLFQPTEGGYLFYPHAWSGGYLISSEERNQLVGDWHRAASFGSVLKLVGVIVVVVLLGTLTTMALGVAQQSDTFLSYPIAVAVIGYLLWKFSAVYRLIRGRSPVAARRSKVETRSQIAKMLRWPQLIFISTGITISTGFLLWVGILGNWIAGLAGLVFAMSSYSYWRIILRKWQLRSEIPRADN